VEKEVQKTKKGMEDSIKAMFDRLQDDEKKKALQQALDLAMPMQPLTPNHHFWIDQGCHARGRILLMKIGELLVKMGLLDRPDDIIYLQYNELRTLFASPDLLDAKQTVARRRKENEDADKISPPDWIGTVTQWSNYEEPYKGLWGFPEKAERDQFKLEQKEFRGIPGSPGSVEGTAVLVKSPNEFDKIKPGDILVCRMTSPAWITVFPKIRGLVTDAGGMLSHPAIVSREFGIPAVIGTGISTQVIKNGQHIRVNGSKGIVEILD
jgi:pyruvate,water dikinase